MATLTLPWPLLVGTRTCRARRSPVVVAAAMLVGLAAVSGIASGEPGDERLSTTLIGALEPGGEPRLAVRWDGEPGALLEVWVDLDGDERLTDEELIVDGRPLQPGIEVVGLEIPAEAYVVSEPRLWVRAVEPDSVAAEKPELFIQGEPSREGCAWQPGFFVNDLDDTVYASTVYDDGSGPALYAGGAFITAGGVVVNSISKWDGTVWSGLSGPAGAGMSGSVYALAVYDDGNGSALIAGGYFTTAGGVTVNHVARWDGTAWSALSGPAGTGVNYTVRALAAWDDGSGPALYAGGEFSSAGGLTVNYIARWNGTAWSGLSGPAGAGMSGSVYALAVYDDGSGPALYAGGAFGSAGGVTANRIARWDGTGWSGLSGPSGTGVDSYVYALAVYDDGSGPALYAGGYFTTAGGVVVNRIARWDGTAWSALSGPSGTGVGGTSYPSVDSLAAYDDGTGPALYAGGSFTTAGGQAVNRIARWDGEAWSALSGPSGTGVNDSVYALAVCDDGSGRALYAGGGFTFAGGLPVDRIARWGGVGWSNLSEPSGTGVNDRVNALAVYDDGSGPALYAGGRFTAAGGGTASYVARWDGTAWSALSGPSGTGMNGYAYALAVYDDGSGPALYAGGAFTTAGGQAVNRIARWDGEAWSALSGPSGTGVSGSVRALAVYDDGSGPALYAGGAFGSAGGVTVYYVARWDGTAWSALSGPSGTGMNDYVYALAVYDDGRGLALYAGGFFTTAGGTIVYRIARWDGAVWSALSGPSGTGVSSAVHALAVCDDGSGPALYVGGTFIMAGGGTVNCVARWDGSRWTALVAPSGTGVSDWVEALVVHDDGSGLALYAGGYFTTAGGVTVDRIARWDGDTWSALSGPTGTGVSDDAYALAVYDDGSGPALYAGGDFHLAGGVPSAHIAAWVCDSLAPTDPTSLASTTHTPGVWSSLDVVDVEWSGAADSGGSGLAGYSLLWDTSPATLPDDTIEVQHVAEPHSTSSGALADGDSHWFHLRTCDNAGNCSGGVHLGPFWIDATPPSGPTNLHSTSHTPGEASCDRSVDLSWSAATDAGSGLDGYAWALTFNHGWTCDQVKDLEEGATVLTTPELGDWVWYVHLCAVDNLGQWGEVASSGPYPICPLFWDDFESGDTSAWSVVVP